MQKAKQGERSKHLEASGCSIWPVIKRLTWCNYYIENALAVKGKITFFEINTIFNNRKI